MLDEYIALHGRRLYGLCVTLCAYRLDPDDLYQETWLRVCVKLHQYKPEQSFEGWLTRVCVNLYRDTLRRQRFSLKWLLSGDNNELLEQIPLPERKDYSDLHAAIDRLPPKLRTTVILHYFHDMDIAATATALNIPPGTVKSRLNTARKHLKEFLNYEPNL